MKFLVSEVTLISNGINLFCGKKKLDQKEQGSRADIEEAVKTIAARLKTFMLRKFDMLKGMAVGKVKL